MVLPIKDRSFEIATEFNIRFIFFLQCLNADSATSEPRPRSEKHLRESNGRIRSRVQDEYNPSYF